MKHMLKQAATLLLLLLLTFSVSPGIALARNYGEGGYGEGQYNVGEAVASTPTSNPSDSLTPAGAPGCNDQSPGSKAPWLYSAVAQNGNSILLYFTEADDPVNTYALEFGSKSGDYPYGSTNIGGKGLRTYLVQSLSPNTTYYFRVRGGNGCAPGPWSNELSATTKGIVSFKQLQTTTLELEPATPAAEETDTIPIACGMYTVKSGDSLWNIALNELGDGNKYKDIIELNKEKYPSLNTSNSVSAGWELDLGCQASKDLVQEKLTEEDLNEAVGGYSVNVKVTDKTQKPVEGAKVTIHSKVQEARTNKDGVAKFSNVEPGDHRVLIAYNNYEGEQSINLTGDVKEFNLNVTIQQKSVLTSPLVLAIIGGMSLVIIVLVVLLLKAKSRKA